MRNVYCIVLPATQPSNFSAINLDSKLHLAKSKLHYTDGQKVEQNLLSPIPTFKVSKGELITKFLLPLLQVKQGILGVHPDLAGRLAQQGGLTKESLKEQRSAGLVGGNVDEGQRSEICELNKRYRVTPR